MYLDGNLTRLNKRYNPIGFEFRKEGDIIRPIEEPEYLLNKNPELKAYFRNTFKLRFNKSYL